MIRRPKTTRWLQSIWLLIVVVTVLTIVLPTLTFLAIPKLADAPTCLTTAAQPSPRFPIMTYDPTNGTVSISVLTRLNGGAISIN